MIHIYAHRKDERCRLYVTGHADGGEERHVICAGVSALTGALVLYAAANCKNARYYMASGEVFLSCPSLGEGFEIVLRGLCEIAKSYPDQVKLMQYESVDDKIEAM
ncbi:MAG: ribosomal-processing cysteine protease Prp [Clostridia bacterium]|nr:ribosomal-processing cysteine protease Prp [Clostridia bacterium]